MAKLMPGFGLAIPPFEICCVQADAGFDERHQAAARALEAQDRRQAKVGDALAIAPTAAGQLPVAAPLQMFTERALLAPVPLQGAA